MAIYGLTCCTYYMNSRGITSISCGRVSVCCLYSSIVATPQKCQTVMGLRILKELNFAIIIETKTYTRILLSKLRNEPLGTLSFIRPLIFYQILNSKDCFLNRSN